MLNFLKKKYINAINESVRTVRICLYADLTKEYEKEMSLESAKKLAAQSVNYLTGTDFLSQLNVSPEIISTATKKALIRMDHDEEVRQLIVELNKGIISAKEELDGKKYDINKEAENIKRIITFYTEEYLDTFKLTKLEKLAAQYQKRIFNK